MTAAVRRISTRGLVAGGSLMTAFAIMLFVRGDSDAYSDNVALARGLGYLAFVLLSAALCVSPLGRWLRESSKLRRALGLAAAGWALFHAEVGLWSSPLSVSVQLDDPQLRFGFGALAVLGLLAVTSFPGAVRALKLRSWKELHRLAYVAWICALLHGLLSPYAWVPGLCVIAVVVLALAPLRLLPRVERTAEERAELSAPHADDQ